MSNTCTVYSDRHSMDLRFYACLFYLKPKQIQEIKDFLITARRKDAKCEFQCVSPLYSYSLSCLSDHTHNSPSLIAEARNKHDVTI